jgi:hypothetical protein
MSDQDLVRRVEELDDHESERLLQAVMDLLLTDVGTLGVGDEESARELVAAFVSRPGLPATADDILRPSVPLAAYVHATLALLAADPRTAPLVEAMLDQLADETQMFADPVTAALVLGALVAFLQTKFDVHVSRKEGKVEFEFAIGKDATSDEIVGKVADAVRGVVVR